MLIRALSACLLVSAMALASGCGTASVDDAQPAPEAAVPNPLQDPEGELLFASETINSLATKAQVGILGKVVEVSPVRWNIEDGAKWEATSKDSAIPVPYRDVKIEVSDVVFRADFETQPGAILDVRLRGDGTDTGAAVGIVPGLRYNRSGGDAAVGDAVLLLAHEGDFPMREGHSERVLLPVNGFQGLWTVRGESVDNVDPMRRVPLQALLDRIADERERGAQPYSPSDRSDRNPLAKDPRSTPSESPVPCYGEGCGKERIEREPGSAP